MEAQLETPGDDFAGLDKAAIETWHINLGGLLARAEGTLALWREHAVSSGARCPEGALGSPCSTATGSSVSSCAAQSHPGGDILQGVPVVQGGRVVVTSATMTALNSFERFIPLRLSP